MSIAFTFTRTGVGSGEPSGPTTSTLPPLPASPRSLNYWLTHRQNLRGATEDVSLLANAIEKYLANITALKSEATSDGYACFLRIIRCRMASKETVVQQQARQKKESSFNCDTATRASTVKWHICEFKKKSVSQLVTPDGTFKLLQDQTECDFERAVVSHVRDIFGERRIKLDCKRRIGAKEGKQSVPDAYLIDLSRPREPQLYVVENELSTHDLFKHIGVQLLQFSVSFTQAGRKNQADSIRRHLPRANSQRTL